MERIMVLHEAKNDHWDATQEFLPMGLALTPMDSGEIYPDVYGQFASSAFPEGHPVPFFAFGDSSEDDEDADFDDMEEDDFDDEEEIFDDDEDEDDDDDDEEDEEDDDDEDDFDDGDEDEDADYDFDEDDDFEYDDE